MATRNISHQIPGSVSPATDARVEPGRSTIWRKLERFDRDKDGKLRLREIYSVFRSIGFSPVWSAVSAVATALWRGPQSSGRLTFTIDLAHIDKAIIKGQTGAWDENANPIPGEVEKFLADVNADGDGKVTLDELRARVAADAKASIEKHPPRIFMLEALTRKRRFVESFSAWVQLMEVSGQKDENGIRYLTLDQVRSVFDGTLFEKILSQPPREARISAARVVKELFGPAIKA